MGRSSEGGRFVRGFLVPLLLILGGGGLIAVEKATDVAVIGYAGLALAGIGLLWIVFSCIREGIDIFDF